MLLLLLAFGEGVGGCEQECTENGENEQDLFHVLYQTAGVVAYSRL